MSVWIVNVRVSVCACACVCVRVCVGGGGGRGLTRVQEVSQFISGQELISVEVSSCKSSHVSLYYFLVRQSSMSVVHLIITCRKGRWSPTSHSQEQVMAGVVQSV